MPNSSGGFSDAGLYSGGQGIFNSTPFTQYILKQHAVNQSKDEALDKYYNNLPNTINEQGVRDQEIPLLHDKKNDIQQYYQQNRDAIKKGNTPEAFNLGKKFRDAQGIIQESKNRAATAGKLAQMRANPKMDYVFRNQGAMDAIMKHELPINDPNSQAINYDQFIVPPKPIDVNAVAKKYTDVKYDEGTPQIAPHPTDLLSNIVTQKPILGDAGKSVIKERAASQYDNEPDFANEIDNLSQHPDHLIGLNAVHQKVFGTPISFDADGNINKHDLSAAYVASILPEKPITQKVVPNQSAKMDRQEILRRQLQANSFAEREKLLKMGFGLRQAYKDKTEEDKIKDVDGFTQSQIDEAKQTNTGAGSQLGNPDGNLPIKASPLILASFTQKDPNSGHTYTPTGIKYSPKNDNMILMGAKPNGGDVEITRKDYNASLVNHAFNSPTKLAEIHTNKTVDSGKSSTTKSGSSSSKGSQPAIVEQGGHKFKLNLKTGKYEYYQ